jgi:rhamnose utilization protein RhaD (predicted bifunctional aldolase and dehydrogenase)/NAD(P)-dependent dehydrogenase (short-subunit alcohol dehydrogenase family)
MSPKIPWPQFESGDSPIEQLVKLSRYFGSDIDFVIAGGGNTSVKIGTALFVKPSGVPLATIQANDFVEMTRDALATVLTADFGEEPDRREARFKSAILSARAHPEKSRRPSVECVLHHLLPRRFVVHTHSTVANWLTCSRDGQATARRLFEDNILWIPYVDPGYVLARSIRDLLGHYQARTGRDCPGALLMENHGLIVCGDTPEEVRDITNYLGDAIRDAAGADEGAAFQATRHKDDAAARRLINTIGPLLRGLLADGESLKVVCFDDSSLVLDFVGSENGREMGAAGPFTPDQIVYCNSFPLWFEAAGQEPDVLSERLSTAVREHVERTGIAPLVVLVRGLGMFTCGKDYAAAQTVRLCYTDAIRVAAGAARFGGARPLAPRDRQFIEQWEVEAYRRQVAAGAERKGRVAGKVALVTGGAQGFGKEIAEALADEGAHVLVADLNLEGAQCVAGRISRKHGQGRGAAVPVDVTSNQSVAEAVHRLVRSYGGVDLLVSNAGVLLAGSVKDQSVRDFDLVTSVNYKGYFVCVQTAAPVMALQRRARPDYWSDIIQINSKSGLMGSNRNSAYAGSKFGGIGLTQSFALELIEDGIKVNAICPGNFFEGPLWSDPSTGLFVQYLRTGKVPGAKTIGDVRRAYEAKVPMRRGCTTADVMKAIYYLVEQKYETGQALPVTGGQVMLG